MIIPMLPVLIAGLTSAAYLASSQRPEKGKLTPARQMVFEIAINEVKDIEKLEALAKAFRAQGLEAHATLLEKRAKLRKVPPEIKSKRKVTFRKAMASSNPVAVRAVAAVYDEQGATGAANALRDYADSLVKQLEETPIAAPTPQVQPEQSPVEHIEETATPTEHGE